MAGRHRLPGARSAVIDRPTPLYFDSAGQSLWGWLHLPESGRPTVGLIVCNPFGYDAICAHRSLRAFAAAAAGAGLAALRFDYTGTGDSTDAPQDAEQIDQWCSDIRAAAAALREQAAVEHICLLGLGLGALLAARAADAACGLIAIAPVVNGRRYLRELRAFQAAASPGGQALTPNGDLEVTGFRLSAASAAVLAHCDLAALKRPPAPALLVIDRSDLPMAKPWADAMQGLGAEVEYRSLAGFTDMMTTPHATVVPRLMVEAATRWLGRFNAGAPVAAATPAASGAAVRKVVRWPGARISFMSDGVALEERALFIDEHRTLFAIVTQALHGAGNPSRPRRGVVFLNAGATHHVGPNRMYVPLARSWAARGWVALRLDLAGLGDSGNHPGQQDNLAYPPAAVQDIAAAVQFLMRQYAVTDVTLTGLCAGAYHALRAAAAGLPVSRALMINPLTFFWEQGMTMNDLQMAEVVRNPGVYRERMMSPKHWLKLLRGRVNLWRVAMIYVRRVWLVVETALRDLSHALRIRLPRDLRWDLEAITGRGVRLVFLFARGDTGEDLLKIQGGAAVRKLGDLCRVHIIDGGDHIFSQCAPREELLRLLGSELMDELPVHPDPGMAAHAQRGV